MRLVDFLISLSIRQKDRIITIIAAKFGLKKYQSALHRCFIIEVNTQKAEKYIRQPGSQ